MTRTRRWSWLLVLIVGAGLYLLVLRTLVATKNPNFVPALILLGASVVPAAFLAFTQARSGHWRVPASMLAIVAFFGGVIGVVAAGTWEYDVLRDLGVLPMVFVGLIEEVAKLIVPGVVLFAVFARRGRREPADGLVVGVASGMGFAALETMGYAFTALLAAKGDLGAVEQTLFIRGLLAPAGHTAWTGLTCGALWAFAANPHLRQFLTLAATFVGAVTLHTAWDSLGTVWGYAVVGVASLTWLTVQQHRYRTFDDRHPRIASQRRAPSVLAG
ncbi:PrsW family intramembrane metalloprotease [Dactylosporangium sp. NPDC005572]|uniref:PrsW family intramembrane metalloprotease n=1 Tax=Dactylosporangium sp. NPDC005572 TaxID=3156889 RepID=UPI0033B5A2DD